MIIGHNSSNNNEYDDDGDYNHCDDDVDDDADVDDTKDDNVGYHLVHCCTMSLVIWVLIMHRNPILKYKDNLVGQLTG